MRTTAVTQFQTPRSPRDGVRNGLVLLIMFLLSIAASTITYFALSSTEMARAKQTWSSSCYDLRTDVHRFLRQAQSVAPIASGFFHRDLRSIHNSDLRRYVRGLNSVPVDVQLPIANMGFLLPIQHADRHTFETVWPARNISCLVQVNGNGGVRVPQRCANKPSYTVLVLSSQSDNLYLNMDAQSHLLRAFNSALANGSVAMSEARVKAVNGPTKPLIMTFSPVFIDRVELNDTADESGLFADPLGSTLLPASLPSSTRFKGMLQVSFDIEALVRTSLSQQDASYSGSLITLRSLSWQASYGPSFGTLVLQNATDTVVESLTATQTVTVDTISWEVTCTPTVAFYPGPSPSTWALSIAVFLVVLVSTLLIRTQTVRVTRVKRLLAHLENAKDEADKANNSKSALLAFVCHELRNPLNACVGVLEWLRGTELTKTQKEYTASICASTELMTSIVNDVLDLGRMEAGKIEFHKTEFNLWDLLDTVFNSNRPLAMRKRLGFVLEKLGDIPGRLIGDRTRITQIFMNLLSNAFKFTKQGEVRMTVRKAERTLLDLPMEFGEYDREFTIVEFCVQDTGSGIPAHTVPKLFEAYSQAKTQIVRETGGSGLGLAIVKSIIQGMSGQVSVTTTLGKGTCFCVLLPLGLPNRSETKNQLTTSGLGGTHSDHKRDSPSTGTRTIRGHESSRLGFSLMGLSARAGGSGAGIAGGPRAALAAGGDRAELREMQTAGLSMSPTVSRTLSYKSEWREPDPLGAGDDDGPAVSSHLLLSQPQGGSVPSPTGSSTPQPPSAGGSVPSGRLSKRGAPSGKSASWARGSPSDPYLVGRGAAAGGPGSAELPGTVPVLTGSSSAQSQSRSATPPNDASRRPSKSNLGIGGSQGSLLSSSAGALGSGGGSGSGSPAGGFQTVAGAGAMFAMARNAATPARGPSKRSKGSSPPLGLGGSSGSPHSSNSSPDSKEHFQFGGGGAGSNNNSSGSPQLGGISMLNGVPPAMPGATVVAAVAAPAAAGAGVAVAAGAAAEEDGEARGAGDRGQRAPQRVQRTRPSAGHSSRSASAAQAIFRGHTALVVDDSHINQKILSRLLSAEGFSVAKANNGQVALDMVKKEPARFSVIFMDLQMPVLSGHDSTVAIRALGCRVPVIAVTGSVMPSDRAQCEAEGFNGFLPKPITRADLLALCAKFVQPLPQPQPAERQPVRVPSGDADTATAAASGSGAGAGVSAGGSLPSGPSNEAAAATAAETQASPGAAAAAASAEPHVAVDIAAS